MTMQGKSLSERDEKPIVRVTQLEKFRRFIYGVSSYDTEQSVIDTICGSFTGNTLTRIGTAFHHIIETGTRKNIVNVDGNKVRFSKTQVQTAIDYRDEHSTAFHEIRQYKDYGEVIVTGCADLIEGVEIRDVKTKFAYPNDSHYTESAQWKFYLDIFGAESFHFDLFVFMDYVAKKHGYDVSKLCLERYSPPITCYRYPGLEVDNMELVSLFVDWARHRNLLKYLATKTI